jgi:hypothetical protein
MADPIQQVMSLACCDRDEAVDLLNKSGNDVIEAVSLKFGTAKGFDAPKPRQLSKIQEFFKETREEMTKLTESISKGFTSSDQSDSCLPNETQILPEEMAPQNSCSQECHPQVLESVVQIPEIAYPLPSECSSDLQSSDQTSASSHQESPQPCPSPKME